MYRTALVVVAALSSAPAFAQSLQPTFKPKKVVCLPGSTLADCLNARDAEGQDFGSTGRERVQVYLEDLTLIVSQDRGEVSIQTERGVEVGYMDAGEDVVAVVAYDVNDDGLLDLAFETESGAVWSLEQESDATEPERR